MLRLIHSRRLGLEIWIIELSGSEVACFLSEQHARNRFERMRQQMARAVAV